MINKVFDRILVGLLGNASAEAAECKYYKVVQCGSPQGTCKACLVYADGTLCGGCTPCNRPCVA